MFCFQTPGFIYICFSRPPLTPNGRGRRALPCSYQVGLQVQGPQRVSVDTPGVWRAPPCCWVRMGAQVCQKAFCHAPWLVGKGSSLLPPLTLVGWAGGCIPGRRSEGCRLPTHLSDVSGQRVRGACYCCIYIYIYIYAGGSGSPWVLY